MNNTERKLDALIAALGFDVETSTVSRELHSLYDSNVQIITSTDYKLTKRNFNNKPSLHKVVREYEQGTMSYGEMLGRIALMESDYENI